MQSFQFLINSMKAFTTVIWEFVAATKSVCVKYFPSLSFSPSLKCCLCFTANIERLLTHTHIRTQRMCAFGMHSKSWQYKSHCVRPVAWHWKVLHWTLKTDGNQCCYYVQLFHFVRVCVRVCVLNLVVDLSLLSALCAALCAQLHPFAALLVILSFTC